MGTERDPDRYAPLDETQRRLAEEEETRRSAEAEQIAARARAGHYEPLRDTQRMVAEEELGRAAGRAQSAGKPERGPSNEIDEVEARTAAREKELDEKVRLGRITASDKVHEMRQFDSELLGEMKIRDERRAREEQASTSQQQDRGRDDPSEARLQTSTEQESASEEHELASRGETTDARAARKARLRGIDHQIERERQENEDKEFDRDRNSGDRSR